MGDEVKGSRLRRAMTMTGAAAGVAARTVGGRAVAGRTASPERRERANRQQIKAAHQLVKVLGGMRGAAMKVGQTLSAVDLGLVPEELRPEMQEILAQLQHSAEPVSFDAIRKVAERDLGLPLAKAFADFDPEPIAAASIGQVHRATLHDGRDVAVKVQYPGITEAIQADMKNLRLGLKLLNVIAPGIDTAAIADELRERIAEELDYELEAQNQRAMARAYRGHPFIVVPSAVADLSRERVIVSDWVDGARFAEAKESSSQEERNRMGEILVRFYVNGPLRHRLLNGDPHPGNALFLADGRVAFLDFGFFKRLSDREVASLRATTRATHERDARALLGELVELGALEPNPDLAEPFLEAYETIFGWIFQPEPLAVDGTRTGEMMRRYTQLRGAEGFESLTLPAEHLVLMRAVMLLIGLLGQLRAENRWLDITREWLYGDEPTTDLGREEARWLAGAPS
jgi:predicted unusual protein kinase regulating ubiquinone biosynthesis (AarF/ABC1/UbiB family)